MSKHIAVWSVGEFLPGQEVTGVTKERLAELVELGAVEVQAPAKASEIPVSEKPQAPEVKQPAPEPSTAQQQPGQDPAEQDDNDQPGALTVEQIKAQLTEQGIEFDSRARKADLLELLNQGV